MINRIKLSLLLFSVLLISCSGQTSHTRGVYLLLDTSGTYTEEINKGQAIINYLLGTLTPGDSLAVARIDSGSFSEKDIIAKVTFDNRPSTANAQKRTFQEKVNNSSYTDISGGVLQGVEFLNETGAANKYILIFSDLKEDLEKGHIRDFPIAFRGVHVVALNVTKLKSDNIDPRKYLERVEKWQTRVESGGGTWRMVNDLDRIDSLLDEPKS